MQRGFLTVVALLICEKLLACLILFLTDGKEILVANHEDWAALDAEIVFQTAQNERHGFVAFAFASEGWPQGGMNTSGLFLDGTATPYAPYPGNENKKDCKCYIWTKILEKCSTVEAALQYIRTYKIPELENIHVMLADKSGASAVVGVYNKELKINYRRANHQLLTNFNATDPSYGGEEPCKRFETATQLLKQDTAATQTNLEKILAQTHQEELTAYSNIYNLTKGEVTVYYRSDFKKGLTYNIAAELKKGSRRILLSSLFEK